MSNFLLAPGQLVARLFQDNKKGYRSVRKKQPAGPLVVVVSVGFWVGLLALGFFLGAMNKSFQSGSEGGENTPVAQSENAGGVVGAESAGGTAEGADASGSTAGTLTGSLDGGGTGTASGSNQTVPANSGGTPPAGASVQESPQAEAWLVILHTIPKDARSEADRRQAQYRAKGLEVEILDTDAYPRLLGGYWIVALGPFDDRATAASVANNAKKYNSGLMIKRGL